MSDERVTTRIFVVGTPRSGTTLVQGLLASHAAVTSFTESHFFSRHFRLGPRGAMTVLVADPGPRVREFLSENGVDERGAARLTAEAGLDVPERPLVRVLQTRRVARQLLGVLDRLAARRNRPVWVEKTARHLHYVPFLQRVSGRARPARFVHVIRDGLDVVASLYAASQKWPSTPDPFARGPSPPYDLETCVRRWNHDLARSLARVGSEADQFIFYEDLTRDPEATLAPVLRACGLAWDPAVLVRHADTARELITPAEPWKRVAVDVEPSSTVDQVFTGEQRTQAERSLRPGLYRSIRDSVRRA